MGMGMLRMTTLRRVAAPPPKAFREQGEQRRRVDSKHPDARLAEAPSVDVDDRGRAGEGLHGADDGRGDHEDAREEEHRDADLAWPRDAEAEEERGRDAQDGDVGEDVEDDEGPEVLGAERAVCAGEGFDLPVVMVPAVFCVGHQRVLGEDLAMERHVRLAS